MKARSKTKMVTFSILVLLLMTGCANNAVGAIDSVLSNVPNDDPHTNVGIVLIANIDDDSEDLVDAPEDSEEDLSEDSEEEYAYDENGESNQTSDESIKIGVTTAHFDNVGQILRHFGAGVDFYVLTRADSTNIERLSEFYAIFINCGSQDQFNYRVLNSFVYQGGIVYASDLTGSLIQSAFPGVVEFDSRSSQLISEANIAHSTLASHMRISYLDVYFDLNGWSAITNLDDNATVYIKGNVLGSEDSRELTPLAISFDYGEGTVFYTSFHNSAQATSHMINFIEYLIFRIKNVEVDRDLQNIAEREGFVYRGAVFGESARLAAPGAPSAPVASAPVFGAPPMPQAGAAPSAPAPASPGVAAMPDSVESEAAFDHTSEVFRYTFEGNDFMLMFGAGSEFYYVTLTDPSGNIFIIDNYGAVTNNIIVSTAIQPVITLQISDGYRVRVSNVAPGEWSFTAMPRNADHSTFMIGIAVME